MGSIENPEAGVESNAVPPPAGGAAPATTARPARQPFIHAPQEDCGEVNQLLDDHIGHVAARIAELRTLEKQLKALRQQCGGADSAQPCGIIQELDAVALEPEGFGQHAGHVHGALHARR